MIVKTKDSMEADLSRLEQQSRVSRTYSERRSAEKRLAITNSGVRGEKDAAYHIDFFFKDSPNWAVIHDLRIEWGGRTAQIDHLLLDRCLEAYVVETKNYTTKVRHANGGWERLLYNHWDGIPCPGEQNERHILVLKNLIEECRLAPARLGRPMPVTFFNRVVVAPSCSIVGKFPGHALVCRMDQLPERIHKEAISTFSLLKLVSPETLLEFGHKLVHHHKPAGQRADMAVPTMSDNSPPQASCNKSCENCQGCRGQVTTAEANYCQLYKKRFAGQLLCQKCQKFAPKTLTSKSGSMRCAGCGTGVEAKVATYCQCHSKRFGNRLLCRKCQNDITCRP